MQSYQLKLARTQLDQLGGQVQIQFAQQPGGGGPGGGRGGGRGGDMTPDQMDRQSEDSFRKADKDGDGQLQYNEMPDNLKPVWEKYDANKDGSINLEEYKSYYRDRMQIRLQENA